MAVYYEDRCLRPRQGAVPRRAQRNLTRWRRAWVPRVGPRTDPDPVVSRFTRALDEIMRTQPGACRALHCHSVSGGDDWS